jgi:hypothetical protein
MRRYLGMACLAAACIVAPAVAQETPPAAAKAEAPSSSLEEVITMRVDGELVVGTDGKTASYTLKTKIDDTLKDLIAKHVALWRFTPVTFDGKPARVRSDMRITLVGRKSTTGYDVSVDNVVFTTPKLKPGDVAQVAKTDEEQIEFVRKMPMPRYPGYNVNGLVTLMLEIGPDGTVAHVSATQCSLYFAGGRDSTKDTACKAMEDSAIHAIRQWRFKLPPGPIVDNTGVMPVQFTNGGERGRLIRSTSNPGVWRMESRGKYRRPEWARDANGQRVGTADMVGNEMLPSNSPLHFTSGGPEGA